MTKNSGIILTLLICIFALAAVCYLTWPVAIGGNNPRFIKLLKKIDNTPLWHKFINHYAWQVTFLVGNEIGPYKCLTQQQIETIQATVASLLFIGLIALIGSVTALIMFLLVDSAPPDTAVPKRTFTTVLFMIIIVGILLRLILAVSFYGNKDMEFYEQDVAIGLKNGNVYAETIYYNYSPVWFLILTSLKKIQLNFPTLPFHFVVRGFLTAVDLLALWVLLLIAKYEKISLIKTATLFFLNPVSFIITGFHGQFENLAILMILVGTLAYLKLADKPAMGIVPLWFFSTAGMIIKHNVFYELITALNFAIKRYWIKISLFLISVTIFLCTFIPYWNAGKEGIINNVFLYSSWAGDYGINTLIHCPHIKYLFIVALILFPFFLKGKDLLRQCLLGFLFFLTFTTGIASQYFLLPVAFGSLRPSKGFMIYSCLASAFILGSPNHISIPGFHLLKWNLVWIGATYWFIEQIYLDRQILQA